MDSKIIEFNGKSIETKFFSNLSKEQCQKIREDFYKKPNIEQVRKNLKSVHEGKMKISDITNYYFKDLMAKTRLHHSKWSLEELFSCDDLIRYVHGKTLTNKKIFPDKDSDIKKIETAIRLSGKGSASKPTNFPLKTIDLIIEKYNVNNVYYDYSCGWGVRLLSSLKHKVDYLGTDPNYLLTERLANMSTEYKKINNIDTKVDIKTQGSEIFVSEWENKVGLAFSSIPYFGLEDYKIGNQSYKEGTSYEEWLKSYLKPTIENIKRYLIEDGNLLLNANNYHKFTIVEDAIKICEECGFKLTDVLELKNISRTKSNGGRNNNEERILYFKKVK